MKVNIIGGKSLKGSVSIMSDEFLSTASMDDEGIITCKTEKISEALKKFLQPDTRFMPKTLKFLLFMKEQMGAKDLVFIGFLTMMFFLMGRAVEHVSGESFFLESHSWIVSLSVLALIGIGLRLTVATWHGAEHMSIAAYERTQETSLQAISKESPVNPKCGTRLVFPLLVSQALIPKIADLYFAQGTPMHLIAFGALFLVSIECVLQIDHLIGFDRLPITGTISNLIQKYVVTKRPGEKGNAHGANSYAAIDSRPSKAGLKNP